MPGRKIIFRHMRAPGDVLMMSAGIRDFKLVFPEISLNVRTQFNSLFDNNPYIDRTIDEDTPGVEIYDVGYPTIQGSNTGYIHFTQSFFLDMVTHAGAYKNLPMSVGEFASVFCGGGDKEWGNCKHPDKDCVTCEDRKPKGDCNAREPFISWRKKYGNVTKNAFKMKGDIHVTEDEKNRNMILDGYGVEHYWVIGAGGKRDCTAKIWDWRQFQKVIDHFQGLIKFVQIGRSDHLIEPLRGTINYVNKTPDVRDLVPIVYHSSGCVSNVSFLMHLCSAVENKFGDYFRPGVAIYGGREPASYTWYGGQQILHTNGVLKCCGDKGCWQSVVTESSKYPENNSRMCHMAERSDGRTIQKCMELITAKDVIRSIEKYYEGNIYQYSKPKQAIEKKPVVTTTEKSAEKTINMLASMSSPGGGEQSALKIAQVLRGAGWTVNLFPFGSVHKDYLNEDIQTASFKNGMLGQMTSGVPLLFYGNDSVNEFCESGEDIVKLSSQVIIGINYVNARLPKCSWLNKTGKLKAVVFQNKEKLSEFERDKVGFEQTELIPLFGAVDVDRFFEVPMLRRKGNEPLVVLKHCTADYRKYVTSKSAKNGEKIHVWQRKHSKEPDTKFYERLIGDLKFPVRFEFMAAHPELIEHFGRDEHFVFHQWNELSVDEFLGRGHVYLYRTSNMWRDQYPRCVAEALLAGLPVLTEPRDGTLDRVLYGDTGYYCDDYDQFKEALKKLRRKEDLRFAMGALAKDWARINLDPKKWIDVVENVTKG